MSIMENGYRDDARCEQLAHPSLLQFFVSCFILLGILVSYIPQHYRIVARRSSEGLSPYFVLLGTTSGTCAIANILMLPTSRNDIACCKVNSPFSCFAGLLGIAQIGAQWGCFFLILFLFLIFTPRTTDNPRVLSRAAKEAIGVVALCVIHFLATVLICIIFLALHPHRLQALADVLGVVAGVLAAIQYFPQIYTTWTLKKAGSLSIPMMCMQTPGGFVFAASLAARLGSDGWATWSVYLVLASLQGVLLVMAVIFEMRERRNKSTEGLDGAESEGQTAVGSGDEATAEREREADEDTPLLADNRSDASGRAVHVKRAAQPS